MENALELLVLSVQSGNQESCIIAINKFNPIIKKYSRKLNYDEADTDLVICLLKTLSKLNVSNQYGGDYHARR